MNPAKRIESLSREKTAQNLICDEKEKEKSIKFSGKS